MLVLRALAAGLAADDCVRVDCVRVGVLALLLGLAALGVLAPVPAVFGDGDGLAPARAPPVVALVSARALVPSATKDARHA